MAAQQRHRIGQVGIECGVMADHGDYCFVINQGRTQHAQAIALLTGWRQAAFFDQPKRLGRHQQALRGLNRHIKLARQRTNALRSLGELFKEVELHTGSEYLGVNKASDQIEYFTRVAMGDRTSKQEAGRETMKRRIGEQAVAPAKQPV